MTIKTFISSANGLWNLMAGSTNAVPISFNIISEQTNNLPKLL